MKRRILILPLADRDIDDIAAHIARSRPAAAGRFIDALQACLNALSRHPRLGRRWSMANPRLKGLRGIAIPRFRMVIVFYLLRGGAIVIVRVLHAARDAEDALSDPL